MSAINEDAPPASSVEEKKDSVETMVPQNESEDEYPTLKKLILIMVAIYLCMFIVALVSLLFV